MTFILTRIFCLQRAVLWVSFAVQTVAVFTKIGNVMDMTIAGTRVTNGIAVRFILTHILTF